jgi:hypothetical protein
LGVLEKTTKDKIEPMGVLEKTRIIKRRLNPWKFWKKQNQTHVFTILVSYPRAINMMGGSQRLV